MHLPVPDRVIEHPLDLFDTPRAAEHPDHSRIGPEPDQERQVGRRDRGSTDSRAVVKLRVITCSRASLDECRGTVPTPRSLVSFSDDGDVPGQNDMTACGEFLHCADA
jgi:hypothetical protein